MLKKISERCIAPAASPMIKDIKTQNENALPSDRVMEKLHADFPQCFTNEGKFDLEKFKSLLNDKVDVTEEGYDLNFLGKNYANLIASTETETVLQPDLEHNSKPENKDSQNIYISGDNLDALKHLLKSYAGKIKCIYIDPPYNTGSDGFVYNDKFNFTTEQLQTKLGIGEEKAKRILDLCKRGSASHSAWLMFMAPRLMLARDLLTEDGVIFISIDDNEQANLKLLCDSIYGEENLLGVFIWHKKLTGGYDNDNVNTQHEYILSYSKDSSYFKINTVESESKYKLIDEKTGKKYKWDSLWNVGGLSYSKSLDYPIIAPDGSEIWPIGERGVSFWLWSKEHVEKERDELKFSKDEKSGQWKVYKKVFASDGLIPGTITLLDKDKVGGNTNASDEIKSLFDGKKVFDYPKPTSLLKDIFERAVTSGDLVMDFFSGSASSADSIMQINSKSIENVNYIMVQLPEKIYDIINGDEEPLNKKACVAAYNLGFRTIDQIGQERIRRAAAKIKAENPNANVDLGFKHFTLRDVPQNTLDKMETFDLNGMFGDTDILKSFGKETVLATWMVKDGYGLTQNAEPLQLADYTAYHCGGHIYMIEGEGFDEKAMIALVDKYGREPEFNPHNVVLFGYSFTFTQTEMLKKNLSAVKKLNERINIDIRY